MRLHATSLLLSCLLPGLLAVPPSTQAATPPPVMLATVYHAGIEVAQQLFQPFDDAGLLIARR